MPAAVLKDGWDGDWFVRAYDAYGKKIGSKTFTKVHAAVPVSQLFFASPGVYASAPATIWEYT